MNDLESPLHKQLALELMRLRDLASMSGRKLAAVIGVSQSMMSRYDTVKAVPPMTVVRAWLEAVDADERTRRIVLELAEAVHGEARPWRVLHGTEPHQQRIVGERDRAAVLIRNFQPTVVPGLLQTALYAEAVLSLGRSPNKAAAVAGRLDRQAVLFEQGRRFEFVIGEHALRWSPTPGALDGQADRLLSVMTMPSVEVRVLPMTADTGVVPWNNFVLRTEADGQVAGAEETMLGARDDVRGEADVAVLEAAWSRLWDAAARGEEATSLIRSRI